MVRRVALVGTQKTPFFIVTAVKISNLTQFEFNQPIYTAPSSEKQLHFPVKLYKYYCVAKRGTSGKLPIISLSKVCLTTNIIHPEHMFSKITAVYETTVKRNRAK
jgi:hypothetical protein